MGFLTSAGADLLLNLVVSNQDHYYLSLITGQGPGTNTLGDELEEPTATDYARALIDNTTSVWTINSGTLYNGVAGDFAEAQADWGIVVGWALTTEPSSSPAPRRWSAPC